MGCRFRSCTPRSLSCAKVRFSSPSLGWTLPEARDKAIEQHFFLRAYFVSQHFVVSLLQRPGSSVCSRLCRPRTMSGFGFRFCGAGRLIFVMSKGKNSTIDNVPGLKLFL